MNEVKIEILIKEVFEKAKAYSLSDKKTPLSNQIVEEIYDQFKERLDKVTLTRLYDKYISKEKPQNSTPHNSTIGFLCKYLGYEGYKDYLENQDGSKEENINQKNSHSNIDVIKESNIDLIRFKKSHLLFIILLLGMLSSIWWLNKSNEQLDSSNPITEEIKSEANEVLQEENKIVESEEIQNKSKIESEKKLEEKRAKPLNIKPNSIGIVIFNNSKIDYRIMQKLQKTIFNGYDASIVNIKDIKSSEIENLVIGDLSILNTINTENVCVGKVTYNFRRSNINSRLIICDIGLFYSVFSRDGKLNTTLSISESTIANGFTELEAKNNAIEKIINKITTL